MNKSRLSLIMGLISVLFVTYVNAAPKFKFTTKSIPNGTVNTAFSFTLKTANAVGTVTYAISAGALPDGLSFDTTTGVISGTPPTVGTTSVTFTANDTATTIELATSITITEEATFTFITTSLPDGEVGVAYSTTLETANAAGTVTYSVSAGALPAGLTLDAVTGVISGTPTTAGTTSVTISANDTVTTVELATSVTITEEGVFAFVTTSLPDGMVGSAYSTTLETANAAGTVTYSVSAGTLPAGLTLDAATGVISGTPTTSGTTDVTLSANDTATTVNLATTITIAAKTFSFVTTSLPNGIVGSAYSTTLETVNAQGTVTYSIGTGALPAGLSLNAATGVISGTPTTAGTASVTISANDTETTINLATSINVTEATVGTFRFLTESLPEGTTNGEYSSYLLTANASGSVTYSVSAGTLPTGLSLDETTGHISGLPTEVNQFDVTFSATDGSTTVTLPLTMKISASGGGGNAGVAFSNTSVAEGRIGTAYSETLKVENGVGPFIYCSEGLPKGLSLDGSTGIVSGTPTEAGTFYTSFSVTDTGENNNKVVTTLPLKVLPKSSDFQFSNTILNNGEVGSGYNDIIATTGGSGQVTYTANGLPTGLSIASDTGSISGTPTAGGRYSVDLTAVDSNDTINTNLAIWIVPSSTSNFYWDFYNLPAAIYNISYDRQPPIYVVADNGTTVTYSAIGLPSGISYNSTSGELTGTAIDIGIYPVTYTAKDSTTGDSISMQKDFVVLPASGGEARDLSVNLWIKKQQIKVTGTEGKDTWKAIYIYNADRRTGNAFDPDTDTFQVTLGNKTITLPAGSFTGDTVFQYKTPKEEAPPSYTIKIIPKKQMISISTSKDNLQDSVPGTLENTVVLGDRSYKMDENYDEKGKFNTINGYENVAFIVDKATLTIKGDQKDSANLSMFMADPSFQYAEGDTLQIKINDSSGNEIINKTFTDLVALKTKEKDGITIYTLSKTGKDSSETNQLGAFKYDTKSGKMKLVLKFLSFTLSNKEEHISVELTIGIKTYFTSLTLFAPKTGKYTTNMP